MIWHHLLFGLRIALLAALGIYLIYLGWEKQIPAYPGRGLR